MNKNNMLISDFQATTLQNCAGSSDMTSNNGFFIIAKILPKGEFAVLTGRNSTFETAYADLQTGNGLKPIDDDIYQHLVAPE